MELVNQRYLDDHLISMIVLSFTVMMTMVMISSSWLNCTLQGDEAVKLVVLSQYEAVPDAN